MSALPCGEISQSATYNVASLPEGPSAGTRLSDFQGELGLVIPIGNYGGLEWSRSSTFVPMVQGRPIVIARGAEVIYRQVAGGGRGLATFIFVPCSLAEATDPRFLEQQARLYGGATGSAGQFLSQLPAAALLSDLLSNPLTAQIGANALLWNSFAGVWERTQSLPVATNGRQKIEDTWANGTVEANGVSIATTGVKLTYTCPIGKVARVGGCGAITTSGTFSTGVIQFCGGGSAAGNHPLIFPGAGTLINNLTISGLLLSAGQTAIFQVTTLQAGVSLNFIIFAEERYAE